MDQFYEDYLERLFDLHKQIGSAFQGLTTTQLDWTPGNDIPSICVLVTHIVGAERYWIADVAAGEFFERDREAEFRASGCSLGHLEVILAEGQNRTVGLLEGLSVNDLSRVVVSHRDGKHVTVFWALQHALAHTGIHLGHIQILRQLIDQTV